MKLRKTAIALSAVLLLLAGCKQNTSTSVSVSSVGDVASTGSTDTVSADSTASVSSNEASNTSGVKGADNSEEGKVSEENKPVLDAEAVIELSKKHDALTITDIKQYTELPKRDANAVLQCHIPFLYEGERMYLRVIDYQYLQAAIVFSEDYLSLSPFDEPFYEKAAGDIRLGNIEHVLNGHIPMSDYITFDLPEGYGLSEYRSWIGSRGGAYLIKQGEDIIHDWGNTGFTAEEQSYGGVEMYGEGQPSVSKETEYDPIKLGDVVIERFLGKLDRGPDNEWYFAIAEKEGGLFCYIVYLNPKIFGEQDFLKLTESISFEEHAFLTVK
ncbi:MAG: hypothetical protein K5796_10360 [Lachnospiraceae bacterium]|nr:hypothetical protein [Lachnospiraceae bacterium]